MSKLNQIEAEDFAEEYDSDIGDDDYGFVLGPDGELKSVFFPDVVPFKTPKNVAKILKMYGITDPGRFGDPTLH